MGAFVLGKSDSYRHHYVYLNVLMGYLLQKSMSPHCVESPASSCHAPRGWQVCRSLGYTRSRSHGKVPCQPFPSSLWPGPLSGHRLQSSCRCLIPESEHKMESWENTFQKIKLMQRNLPCPSIVFLRIKVAPRPEPDLWIQIPRNWLVFPLAYWSAVVTRSMLPTQSQKKWTLTWHSETHKQHV